MSRRKNISHLIVFSHFPLAGWGWKEIVLLFIFLILISFWKQYFYWYHWQRVEHLYQEVKNVYRWHHFITDMKILSYLYTYVELGFWNTSTCFKTDNNIALLGKPKLTQVFYCHFYYKILFLNHIHTIRLIPACNSFCSISQNNKSRGKDIYIH